MVNLKLIESNWKREQFLAYFYLCIANADHVLTADELKVILQKIDTETNYLVPETQELLEDVLEEYKKHSDEEIFEVIKNYHSRVCLTDYDRSKLIHDLDDILNADEVINKKEVERFRKIRNIIKPINNTQYK